MLGKLLFLAHILKINKIPPQGNWQLWLNLKSTLTHAKVCSISLANCVLFCKLKNLKSFSGQRLLKFSCTILCQIFTTIYLYSIVYFTFYISTFLKNNNTCVCVCCVFICMCIYSGKLDYHKLYKLKYP